ncbi:hypothetical protein PHYSODRAFT_341557 [Phytophthora sojae]|uniref:Transmembrane protein n=1 Tax=Phytophthora sojae (strain P6497) TaxID=1094619 RepID=G5ADN4_PHYSP|nr:hypothetical protein PHYSODRAFT_341557 [Phytophthora sojae]EGZ06287.1 hypothetical protein PHYSODRAFT_341557 [Phytophthora sojae]|eukprot:XP_009538184.1 hypothetical protein PHYSODRAFT_341557 [Phytophthora sojae]
MIIREFAQESVPLQDPREGWRVSYGIWIRCVVMTFLISHTTGCQAIHFIDVVSMLARRLIFMSIGVALSILACLMALGDVLPFPVPFVVLTMAPIFNSLQVIGFRVALGRRMFHEMLAQREQLVRFLVFVATQVSLLYVYPAYETLFRLRKNSYYQLLVILLLPALKVIVKNIVRRCTMHKEDLVPESVIFTVDFFNAIYVATCMQSSSSLVGILALTLTDVSQALFTFYGLYRQTTGVTRKPRQIMRGSQLEDDLLSHLLFLCPNPEMLTAPVFENSSKNTINEASSHPRPSWDSIKSLELEAAEENRPPEPSPASTEDNSTLQEDLLAVLFTTECLIATAYLEVLVPLFYSLYVCVMVRIPSARYHTDMAGLSRDNAGSTVFSVFLFGLVQVVWFVVLLAVIKRNCRMKALYQLAFMLETQKALVQGKLMLWMVLTLSFRVVHFGVDFTFQFSTSGYGSPETVTPGSQLTQRFGQSESAGEHRERSDWPRLDDGDSLVEPVVPGDRSSSERHAPGRRACMPRLGSSAVKPRTKLDFCVAVCGGPTAPCPITNQATGDAVGPPGHQIVGCAALQRAHTLHSTRSDAREHAVSQRGLRYMELAATGWSSHGALMARRGEENRSGRDPDTADSGKKERKSAQENAVENSSFGGQALLKEQRDRVRCPRTSRPRDAAAAYDARYGRGTVLYITSADAWPIATKRLRQPHKKVIVVPHHV